MTPRVPSPQLITAAANCAEAGAALAQLLADLAENKPPAVTRPSHIHLVAQAL